MSQPPVTTRAKIRGEFVRKYAGQDAYTAGWDELVTQAETIALPDPFMTAIRQAVR